MQAPNQNTELVVDYLFLRKAIGWLGTLLPIVLIVGNEISSSSGVQESMSYYYYTDMRNIFVGTLCALGVFLVAYDGHDLWDRWITNVAGFFAILVAFCPTKPAVCAANAKVCLAPSVRVLSTSRNIVGDVHLVFAAITFLGLGMMALRFAAAPGLTRGPGIVNWIRYALGLPASGVRSGRQSGNTARNVIYRTCGVLVIVMVIVAALSNLLPQSVKNAAPLLLIFESLAVFAFGVSWFVSGEALESLTTWLRSGRSARATPTPVG